LSVMQKDFKQQALPKPVPIEEEVNGTPDHGLWDFFKDQKPVEENAHGTYPYTLVRGKC
jgi:large subunit ribosomal protein L47